MKNLTNVDLEKLEVIPTRISFHRRIDGKLREQFTQEHYYHGNNTYKKAYRAFKGCVDKHLSVVQRKVRKILHFEESDYYKRYITKERHTGKYRWGYYYLDENDYLRYQEPAERPNRVRKYLPRHAQSRQNRVAKKEREKRELIQVAMINYPGLYQYYVKKRDALDSAYRDSIGEYKWYEYAFRRPEDFNEPLLENYPDKAKWLYAYRHWKWIIRDREIRKKRGLKEYNNLLPAVQKLERGDYSTFLRENQQIFKECAHVEGTVDPLKHLKQITKTF